VLKNKRSLTVRTLTVFHHVFIPKPIVPMINVPNRSIGSQIDTGGVEIVTWSIVTWQHTFVSHCLIIIVHFEHIPQILLEIRFVPNRAIVGKIKAGRISTGIVLTGCRSKFFDAVFLGHTDFCTTNWRIL